MTKSAGDESGKHSVDNPEAGVTPPVPEPEPAGPDELEAQRNAAERRSERTPVKTVTAELTHGIDPVDGSELPLDQAQATGQPVMIPESKGDIRRDVTFPQHIQAPPVQQVVPEVLTKSNSSTSQRKAARAAAKK